MNKLSKGKVIGIVACSMAAVSIAGVGFATWVIGTRDTETSNNLTVKADTVSYESLTLSADFSGSGLDSTINLAGNTDNEGNASNGVSFRGDAGEDLTIKGKFTITAGKDLSFEEIKKQYSTLSFSIEKATTENSVDNFVPNETSGTTQINKFNDFRQNAPSEGFTYFDIKDVSINVSEFTADSSTTGSLLLKYAVTKEISFSWGSYFTPKTSDSSIKDPITFYNKAIASRVNDGEQALSDAYTELDAMKTKYDGSKGKTLSLKMKLNENSSTQSE